MTENLGLDRKPSTGLTGKKLERYLYGDCCLLAMAVNELTGWPIVQIDEGDEFDPDVRHVLVRMPDGRLLDAAGPHGNYSGEEPFRIDQWFPLDVPDDEQRGVDDGIRADAAELLSGLD